MDSSLPLFVFVGILLLALALFVIWAARTKRPLGRSAPPPVPLPNRQDAVSFAGDGEMLLTDEKFEELLLSAPTAGVAHWYYVNVAGTSHRNDDGTSRAAAIKTCEALTPLQLIHEAENQFSGHAIAVRTDEGLQLGYLPDRDGAEVLRDKLKGVPIIGLFRHRNHNPEGQVVGATIVVARLNLQEM